MAAAGGGDISEWFIAAVARMAAAEGVDQLRETFVASVRGVGFDTIAAGEIDIGEPRRSNFQLNTWPESWFALYQREGAIEFDPIVTRMRTGPGPFSWSDVPFQGQRERWLLGQARGYGWADGLAVTLPRGGSRFGLVHMTSVKAVPDGEWRRLVVLFVTIAYEMLRGSAAGTAVLAHNSGLTQREIEALRLVAGGDGDAAIARKLSVAVSTAHEHVERAKRKLNCRTRAEAVAVAVGLGLLHT